MEMEILISYWDGAKDYTRITEWSNINRNKFLHNEHQNELIKFMALQTLWDVAKDINESVFSAIMADELADAANHKEFVICFRWIDNFLDVNADFIVFYQFNNTIVIYLIIY